MFYSMSACKVFFHYYRNINKCPYSIVMRSKYIKFEMINVSWLKAAYKHCKISSDFRYMYL